MKLCSIRLENVRRFVDPVEISGIGPGLNVLAAPNEQGKSTVFDALHALFFVKATSSAKEVKALIPHAGGDPKVEVEVEVEGARYRVAKAFSKSSGKGDVRIWRNGALLHQSDAAEAWLTELIKSPKDGGPSGLLWVRQGLTGFEDARETEDARRDLMSSVAGEVSSVTGGQRMQRIQGEVRAALDRLVTKRGSRKGGALDQAEAAVADLSSRADALEAQVRDLRDLLARRQELRRTRITLEDPEERNRHANRLAEAEAVLSHARDHQRRLQQAQQAEELARTKRDTLAGQIRDADARLAELSEAEAETAKAQETLLDLERQQIGTQVQLAKAKSLLEAAQKQADTARAQLDRVIAAEAGRGVTERRLALQAQLEQAQKEDEKLRELSAAAGRGPDPEQMQQIEAAREALMLVRRGQEAAAAAVSVTYEAGQSGSVLLDGTPLIEGTRHALPEGGELTVPGVARLHLHAAQTGGAADRVQAEQSLQQALAKAGAETVAAARQAAQKRQRAEQGRQATEALLKVLSPNGVRALHDEVQALPQVQEDVSADLPTKPEAEADWSRAQELMAQAQAQAELDRREAEKVSGACHGARARLDALEQRLERARLGCEAVQTSVETRSELLEALHSHTSDAELAAAQTQALLAAAPDLAQAEAAVLRARSVIERAQADLQRALQDLAGVDARIDSHASAAVEEELADVTGQLETARARLAAVEFEVAVLQRLDTALQKARQAAQDHYVRPVLEELRPLLATLWPEAQISLDAENVLPEGLQRGHVTDDFDALSGGTQEQIALLVRIAFARLLARSGRAAPLILDDAIVYTDDARIERIFDTLTAQANELQIIVFSCRQKAFRDLGGTALRIDRAEAGSSG